MTRMSVDMPSRPKKPSQPTVSSAGMSYFPTNFSSQHICMPTTICNKSKRHVAGVQA